MKLIRWKYVAPRLAVLLIVVLTIRLGLDPLVKSTIVSSGEAALGAKVELEGLETSLADGRVTLRHLALANPDAPMRNLLEAERYELRFDTRELLQSRLHVFEAELSGVEFDTERTTSGALEMIAAAEESEPSVFDPWVDSAEDFASDWLNEAGRRLELDLVSKLKTPQLVEELEARWSQESARLKGEVAALRTQAKSFEENIRELKKNPLRNVGELQSLHGELVAVGEKVKSLEQEIRAFPQRAEADRRAVLAARLEDEAFIRAQLKFTSLDEAGLTQTLLGQSASENLATAIDWIRWARALTAPAKLETEKSRSRGTTVHFGPRRPQVQIDLVRLAGRAKWQGRPLELVGTLRDFSSAPQLAAAPMTLELHGSASDPSELLVTVDRRGEQPIDQLTLNCPALWVAGRTLGTGKQLAIELAPGTATINAELTLTSETLEGTLSFAQQGTALHVCSVRVKNQAIATAMEQAVSGINSIEATLTVAGTLDRPQLKIESPLGGQLAQGLSGALRQALGRKTDALLAETREKVDARLDALAKIRDEAGEQFLANLDEGRQALEQLAQSATGGLPVPQLSHSLRLPTQLK